MRRDYNLKILQLGLRDLVDKRKADLVLSNAGKYFAPKLEKNLTMIDGLPPAYVGGEPMADDLDRMDRAHNGWGSLIYFTTEAAMRRPNAPARREGAADPRQVRSRAQRAAAVLHAGSPRGEGARA